MSKYNYIDGKFTIEDYDCQKPFASFLPGVAGVNGIPMWAYYTNRGQGIAGFGVENKDGSILDFVPANIAYRRTELQGYRTFIKIDNEVHEIFSSISKDDYKRKMIIEENAFGFEEVNHTIGLKVTVKYFTVTNKSYPGLVRKVTINALNEPKNIELVDGLMTLWPYKIDNFITKNMANLAVAWFEAYNTSKNMPFFRNRSTTDDSATIGSVEAGHFFAAFNHKSDVPMAVIYDPDILFGENTSLLSADMFSKESLSELLNQTQVSANKLPCAFACYTGEVDSFEMYSVTGKLYHIEQLHKLESEFCVDYFKNIETEAEDLMKHLTDDVASKTAFPKFDAYVKQSYMDNFLRGGYPLVFEGKEGPIVYHVFSRIHGDMEREYNDFYVEPAYYSHGIGNFRDVNQNRRNDVFFEKEAGLFNIKQFTELLQVDGQNPLSIQGSTLTLDDEGFDEIIQYFDKKEIMDELLKKPFTPGLILKALDDFNIEINISRDELLKSIMKVSIQENHAAYGHGFWVDHWTYNMDLIENYLAVYPDRLEALFYDIELKSFMSTERVLPRSDKYVLTEDNKVRQYDAIIKQETEDHWIKTKKGDDYKTNIFIKQLTLVMNKITNLDPSGIGIMMNSDKPGWNDAMNGLPGLFGSGTSEVIELKRVNDLLLRVITEYPREIVLPSEIAHLIREFRMHLIKNLNHQIDDLTFFNTIQDLKEEYLEAIKASISEPSIRFSAITIKELLEYITLKIKSSIDKALEMGDGILPSYLVHEAVEFVVIKDKYHPINGLPNVNVKTWHIRALPKYLEGPARYLKQANKEEAKEIFDLIRNSELYDDKLEMYVTSESLEDESLEIGRARAFTAGWLERESVFMHMEYKYLLGVLKSGLYDEYYESIKTAFPPFMDAEVYGRSTLENSSFIASSRNPNEKNHGRGFVSRLTGTTSELISMWMYMMTGMKLFTYDQELEFKLSPKLMSTFFDDQNQVKFTLFKDIEVIYDNPKRLNTYDLEIIKYRLEYKDSHAYEYDRIIGKEAHDIRDGKVSRIVVTLG